MRGKRIEERNSSKLGVIIVGILIVILIVIVFCIFIVEDKEVSKNTLNYNSSYTKNETNTGYDSNSKINTKTTTHYCDASGCTKKGTYSINGTSGKEYYCYEHYKQMEQWAEMLMGY